ncbi:hypothetical protein EV356DRAFT_451474 [Viridothelium virens]|uniref:Transcription initiation factor TFIID subunit 8 n=1 Tax=Viridothelium virens TaxID=1048519 RepID=A0A6A6H140_VIRVR|nr:hypothetical protein EV356DRAFT_451474 [Viridothelium virens]
MQHADQNGIKRASPFTDEAPPPKKQRNVPNTIKHHQLWYEQHSTSDPTLAPQDPVFIQSQLLRSIIIACGAVGFDSITTTALESFRAAVEEYILRCLSLVHTSMDSSRRTQPLPQDFIRALASTNASTVSLQDHLSLHDLDSESSPLVPSVLQPRIPEPPPAEPPPPDLTSILGPSLICAKEESQRMYIPKHFPPLPSQHTWKATPIFSEREEDPRKIRERATEEGMEAERALRNLVAARNAGAAGRSQTRAVSGKRGQGLEEVWKETVAAVVKGDEAREEQSNGRADMHMDEIDLSFGFDGSADKKPPTRNEKMTVPRKLDEHGGMMVNYEKKYWRKAAAMSNG